MKTVAIISAMEIELSYVEEFLDGRYGWKPIEEHRYENSITSVQLITKVIGVGKVNAAYQTADLIAQEHPDLIINVGYAGGLIADAHAGDVAIGTDYVQVDFLPYKDENRTVIRESPKEIVNILLEKAAELSIHAVAGRIATGDFFLHDSVQKNRIINDHSPIAFDMESAAIAQVATVKNVDFVSIRTFSDMADESAVDAFKDGRVLHDYNMIPIERQPVVLALVTLEGIKS